MARQALTQKAAQAFAATARPKQETFDAIVPGFGVRAGGAGGSWVFVYVQPGTGRHGIPARRRRYIIGRLGVMPLAQARAAARGLKDQVQAGRDPCGEKQAGKQAAAIEAADTSDTFAALVDEYFAWRGDKLASGREMRSMVERHCAGLMDRKAADISQFDVSDCWAPLMSAGQGAGANRVYSTLSQIFGWAARNARCRVALSPLVNLEKPASIVRRKRTLTDDEIRALWKALDITPGPFGALVKVLLLTGKRREETALMIWDRVDLDRGVWTVPAEDQKNAGPKPKDGDDRRVDHTVFLADTVCDLIAAQPRFAGSPFVFPGRNPARPISGWSTLKRRLDDLSEVTDWRLHDLRRTFRSRLTDLGIGEVVGDLCLNHSIGGLRGVYVQPHEDQMKAAWQAWADHLMGPMVNPGDNVVPLRARGVA